uniref:Uncharacterized protein n=1 Tax=Cyprinus carpio TaxID=7962 RepID=A0A8C1WAU2_CYPCA
CIFLLCDDWSEIMIFTVNFLSTSQEKESYLFLELSIEKSSVSGVNDWRIWYVDNQTVITGGMASVGVWRVCFNSHILDSAEICKSISLTDSFTPLEIAAAQVLCMVAVGVGVIANLVAGHAVRNAIFGVDNGHVRLTFVMAGSLYWLTAVCLVVPVFWNMNSVLANLTIDFPPDFYLPSAPVKQEYTAMSKIEIISLRL